MVDAGSRAASVTIHRVMDVEHGLGNVTGEIVLTTLLNHWVKYYGKPDIARTDPEGAFRDQGFRRGLAAKSMRLDIDPDLAQCSVEVVDEAAKQRLRVKEESYKAYIEEELSLRNVAKRFMKPDLGGIGQQVNAGIGGLANTRARE